MINKYPYTDFNEYNMDWIIKTVKDLTVQWAETHQEWQDVQTEWTNYKNYIDTYFENLDLSQEVSDKIDQMAADGYFSDLFNTLFRADLISEAGTVTSAWIADNLLQETGYVIDSSLTVANAAADAKATGDAISDLNNDLTVTTLSLNGETTDEIQDILKWRVGSVNSSGELVSSTIRLISDFINGYIYKHMHFTCDAGYKIALEKYDLDGTYIQELGFNTSGYVIDNDYIYRVLFGKTDNTTMTLADVSHIKIVVNNLIYNGIRSNNKSISSISSSIDGITENIPVDYSNFVIGNLYDNSGTPTIQTSNRKRVTTATPISLKKGTYIGLYDYTTYSFWVAYGINGTYTFTSPLVKDFVLPDDADCYICIVKSSNEVDIEDVYLYADQLKITQQLIPAWEKYDVNKIVSTLEAGSINTYGVDNNNSDVLLSRRRTKMAYAEAGSVLSVPDEFAEYYFEVASYGNSISFSGWQREHYFDTDTYFRLIARKTDNSSWTTSDEDGFAETIRFANNPVNHYWIQKKENIKSVCHAGLDGAPENTIPAFIEAYNAGFTIMECDSRITSDGVFVLLHDATINRTGRYPDGSVITPDINVSDLTYAQLQDYDFGIWKGQQYAGTKIPKTEDALKLFKDLGVGAYIDMGSYPYFSKQQIWDLMDIVDSCGMHDNVFYLCNSGYASYILEKDPSANIGYVANAAWWLRAKTCLTGRNSVFLDAQISTVTEQKINDARDHDVPMEVWTVTDNTSQAAVDSFSDYITGVTGTINPAQQYYRDKALEDYQ